jgi:hypothetical protein
MATDNLITAQLSRELTFTAPRRVLTSWKEIAGYMGFGVRTVQRYEASLGLPVRRPMRHDRSSVIAFTDEIDAWLESCPKRGMRRSLETDCEAFLLTLEQALEHVKGCEACNSRISATLLKAQPRLVA